MPSKLPVNAPLREFVYDILYHLPHEDRFKLQGKYYNIGRTNSTAKRFCNNASLEQLQHVLTLLGIEWYMVFFPNDKFVGGTQKMLEGVDDDNKINGLRNIIKKRMFITGSKQFAYLLATISQSIYGGIYIKNLQLDKVGYHHRKWTRGLTGGAAKDEIERTNTLNYYSKNAFNTIAAFLRASYSENDFLILLHLYSRQHTFVEYERIVEAHDSVINPRKMFAPIRRLVNLKTIQKHPKKKAYMITTIGVLEVNKIFEEIFKSNQYVD